MDWNEATDEIGMTTWTNERGDQITAIDQGDDEFVYDAHTAEGVLAGIFVTKEQALVAPESMEGADIAATKFSDRQAEDAQS